MASPELNDVVLAVPAVCCLSFTQDATDAGADVLIIERLDDIRIRTNRNADQNSDPRSCHHPGDVFVRQLP